MTSSFLSEGIDWNAIDDQPVHLIFLILTASDDRDTQLEILSTIAMGLGDREAYELLHSDSVTEMWSLLQPMLKKDENLTRARSE